MTGRAVARLTLAALLSVVCTEPNPDYTDKDSDDGPDTDAAVDVGIAADAPVDVGAPVDTGAVDTRPPIDDTAVDAPVRIELARGLIGYWKLDELVGARAARDSVTGAAQEAVLENATGASVWGAMGKFDGAVEVPPGMREIGLRVQPGAAVLSLHHYTAGAWIWRTRLGPDSFDTIISRQVPNDNYEVFSLLVWHDRLRAYVPFEGKSAIAPGMVPPGRWVHAAATYDGEILRLYQDGEQVNQVAHRLATTPMVTSPLYLGTNKNASGLSEPFIGRLDDVVLYNRALAPEEIAALARGERPPL